MTNATTEFSTEGILSQARSNATAFFVTTMVYLKERGLAVEGFVAFFGPTPPRAGMSCADSRWLRWRERRP